MGKKWLEMPTYLTTMLHVHIKRYTLLEIENQLVKIWLGYRWPGPWQATRRKLGSNRVGAQVTRAKRRSKRYSLRCKLRSRTRS